MHTEPPKLDYIGEKMSASNIIDECSLRKDEITDIIVTAKFENGTIMSINNEMSQELLALLSKSHEYHVSNKLFG